MGGAHDRIDGFEGSPVTFNSGAGVPVRHRQRMSFTKGNLHHGHSSQTQMHSKQRLEVAWTVYKSYGAVASRPARSTAVVAAAAASPQEAQPEHLTSQVSDKGLEVFKALIAEKRFICTQCGKCCTGDGEVWISEEEAARIAKYLNMPMKRFLAMHTRAYSKLEGFRMLKSNLDSPTRDCTFLRPDNTCAVHPVRPVQCATYPWWPDLMDEKEWAWERENICEGFDHSDAPETDVTDAARQLKLATIQEYQKRLAYKPSRKQQKAAAVVGSESSKDQSSSRSSSSSSRQEGQQGGSSSTGSTAAASWQERLQRLQQLTEDSS